MLAKNGFFFFFTYFFYATKHWKIWKTIFTQGFPSKQTKH